MAMAATDEPDNDATPPCPPVHAAVVERFISAECAACWRDKNVEQPADAQWLLDWIVPSARGDAAPLSSAAPAEARGRAQRAKAEPGNGRARVQRSAARDAGGLQLSVASGPAWNGYFGVQVDTGGRPAAGASVWIALVESVASGTDGSAVPRELVRTLSGPFKPAELRSGQPWQYLLAMRWPDTAQPARLRARVWIEDASGRIVAMAGERCAR
jgi:hypothetical protein